MTSKQRENFLRHAILVTDHGTNALVSLVELQMTNKRQTFDQFVNAHQHSIFHLYNSSRCCQCPSGKLSYHSRIIQESQMELLFDRSLKLPCHDTAKKSDDFCCSIAKSGICTGVLDITLSRCLLVNFCTDVFWYSCLQFQSVTLEEFLNKNKHDIFHLMQKNTTCCQCQPGYTFPTSSLKLEESDWKQMFRSFLPRCSYHTDIINSICSVIARPDITTANISPNGNTVILQSLCEVRKVVEALVKIRNQEFAHASKCSMLDDEYNSSVVKIKSLIMDIAKVCNEEEQFKNKIEEALHGALDHSLSIKYQDLVERYIRLHYVQLISREMHNYTIMANIVLNILVDVLYDLYKLDVPNFDRERNECDVSDLYSRHRKCNKHIPSTGRWGGNPASIDITIGDDIERIRHTRNELAHSKTFGLNEIRLHELYNIIFELLKRFDMHIKPTKPYIDRLKGFLVKAISDEQNNIK